LNIISLFSGAGGLDLGFEQAGFRPVAAYDKESSAVSTYNSNRRGAIARGANLSLLTGDTIIHEIAALHLDELPRGVVGGPPCQYFSNGNSTPRQENDPRRTLPVSYAHILQRLNGEYQLDFFVMENVYGLASPKHRDDFNHIIRLFEDAGFCVFHDILNAYNFGVPQIRRRVFLVGWNSVLYPGAEYKFPVGTASGPTVKDAIGELEEPQFWARGLNPDEFPEHPNHWTMRPVSDKFKNRRRTKARRFSRSFRRMQWDKPSDTVAYGHNEIHVHPNGHRRLSIYEAMLLQGFPRGRDGYRLMGTLSDQVTLVSDAVPPPLAFALAQSMLQFMEEHPRHG
jgi:DNA (cytosine-5)-methyltransferase 1